MESQGIHASFLISRGDQEAALASEREKLKAAEDRIHALENRLEEHRRIATLASGATWQYEENGCWHALSIEATHQMTQAYLIQIHLSSTRGRCAIINSAGVRRKVDFEMMVQTRSDTKKVRRIRILPGVPKQWISSPAALLQQSDDLQSYFLKVTDSKILDTVQEILDQLVMLLTTRKHVLAWGWQLSNQCTGSKTGDCGRGTRWNVQLCGRSMLATGFRSHQRPWILMLVMHAMALIKSWHAAKACWVVVRSCVSMLTRRCCCTELLVYLWSRLFLTASTIGYADGACMVTEFILHHQDAKPINTPAQFTRRRVIAGTSEPWSLPGWHWGMRTTPSRHSVTWENSLIETSMESPMIVLLQILGQSRAIPSRTRFIRSLWSLTGRRRTPAMWSQLTWCSICPAEGWKNIKTSTDLVSRELQQLHAATLHYRVQLGQRAEDDVVIEEARFHPAVDVAEKPG